MSSTLVTIERSAIDSSNRRAFDTGIHALTVTLLLVAVLAAVGYPLDRAAIHLVMTFVFGFMYFYGAHYRRRWPEWAQILWLFGMTGVWIVELFVSPVAMYWVFILFFMYLRVMDDWRGVTSVIFALAVSILVQVPHGLTLGGVMGPAVSAGVVFAIHYSFRTISRISAEREALIEELVSTREQLADTERAAGVAQERQRLAHEIHDTVAQGLSSIQMLLHAAERDLKNTALSDEELATPLMRMETARKSAADNLAETRAMIAALAPASLNDHSLIEALQRVADSFSTTGDVDITVESHGEEVELPMRVEAGLLRIAQGATGNVVKHSGASRARITLTFGTNEVRLDVVDNGKGFDADKVQSQPAGLGHVGLAAMHRRAEELGGELVVESAPGGPTALSVALPITTINTEPGRINRKMEEDK
ncbi:sensor histidine kinase [Corynebacterium cystitidis]|uniref:sensor histidine kinase n=1 Tax=Corynebacterium cystitidis TaxID=35757 RepID=UPI00211DFF85|nr:sensor histidine kinase [Corynebacterium cystitidis]